MAQRITAYDAAPVSRMMLGASSADRGLKMTPPNQGLNNSDDLGAASKPYVNSQPERQASYAGQGVRQNQTSAGFQGSAAAMDNVRRVQTEQATAQNFMKHKLADVVDNELEQMGGGAALMQLNEVIQSPNREKFVNHIASTKAMFEGDAPELGQIQAEANRYMA